MVQNGFRNEMIEFPNGKRNQSHQIQILLLIYLKGSKVYNGAQTYSMLNGTLQDLV